MNNAMAKTGFTFFLLLFVTGLLFLTIDMGRVAALVPIRVVIPTFILLLIQFVLDLVPGLGDRFSQYEKVHFPRSEELQKAARVQPPGSSGAQDPLRTREYRAFTWVLGLLSMVYLFGVLVSVPLFTFLYLMQRARENWRVSIGMSAGLLCLLWGVFVWLLRAQLYKGAVWRWMGF
jgi:hypothetical protein